MKNGKKAKGFTIVEILIATTIFLMVLAAGTRVYIQSSKKMFNVDGKLDVNEQITKITNQLISDARKADTFILYDNYSGAWIDSSFVNFRNSSYTGKGRLRDGQSGKFLLLLYFDEDPLPHDSNPPTINKLVGIYLDASESEKTGELKYFTKTTINDSLTMEENIPPISQSSSHKTLVKELTGLMDGDIFYNFSGTSIMMNAKISINVGGIQETSTYNFTITPR